MLASQVEGSYLAGHPIMRFSHIQILRNQAAKIVLNDAQQLGILAKSW